MAEQAPDVRVGPVMPPDDTAGLGDLALSCRSASLVAEAVAARRRDARSGGAEGRELAAGPGWRVLDILCCAGPGDRPFEERHEAQSLSLVLAGGFEYRSARGPAALHPGAILLGEAGSCFTCGHRHGWGDRCLSVQYQPDFFEELSSGGWARWRGLPVPALPPMPATAPLFAEAELLAAGAPGAAAEELALTLVERVGATLSGAVVPSPLGDRQARRVAEVVRYIEHSLDADLSLSALSGLACLSPFHFLRLFRAQTGTTPNAYVTQSRLRAAAILLCTTERRVTDIAFEVGFGDLSHFTTAFRRLFGRPPAAFRKKGRAPSPAPVEAAPARVRGRKAQALRASFSGS